MLDEEKNGYVARDQSLYMRYNEGLDMPGVSDLASVWGHKGTRTHQGSPIIYITDNRETCARARILGWG